MGAKQTAALIPLCHPLPLDSCKFETSFSGREALIRCTCKTTGKTGVEMEALTGASVAALAFYDMCKALDPAMLIHGVRLLEKSGGKSDYQAAP
jgi:cyclic pyranopterin phosphate synthase